MTVKTFPLQELGDSLIACLSSISWVKKLERRGSRESSENISHQINPNARPGNKAHEGNAECDRRIERPA
jgi:hypothetical protein